MLINLMKACFTWIRKAYKKEAIFNEEKTFKSNPGGTYGRGPND